MDFLQIGLIFLIALLSVFLIVTGIQVFLILRDLKDNLNRLNKILLEEGSAEKIKREVKKNKPSPRFFKKLIKMNEYV